MVLLFRILFTSAVILVTLKLDGLNCISPDCSDLGELTNCSLLPLCSRFSSSDSTCGGQLQQDGFSYIGQNNASGNIQHTYTIKPNNTIFNVDPGSSVSCHIIRGVCERVDMVDPRQLPEASIRSCPVSGIYSTRNEVFVRVGNEKIVPADFGILILQCLVLKSCVNIYLFDYSDCASQCEVSERGVAVPSVPMFLADVQDLWDKCQTLNISEEQTTQDRECLRKRCISEACSCCSIHCPDYPYYNQNASSLCPSELVTNCSLPSDIEHESYCQENCVLHCDGMYAELCQKVCEDPFQMQNSDFFRIFDELEVQKFCAERVQRNCSELTLSAASCTRSISSEICDRVCQRMGAMGFFAKECPTAAHEVCDDYIRHLLASSPTLTDDVFLTIVNVVNVFLEEATPTDSVDNLELLFERTATELLPSNTNLENLADVFDSLFDDIFSIKWNEDSNSLDSLSRVLRQVETLVELISTSILEGNRNSPFKLTTNNLLISVNTPDRAQAVSNSHRVTVQGDNKLEGFDAEIHIPIDVVCGRNETESCSSAVGVAAIHNLAEYLHAALSQRNQSEDYEYAQYEPATELLSLQVFGVDNLKEMLSQSPAEITLTLGDLTEEQLNSSECVFWNHKENSWSTEGITTNISVTKNTVKCISQHLTSFAVLVGLNPDPGNSTADVALTAISYIGCMISIVCLLATIICLILFRKILNKGPLLYVHLNLAIALLLGYLFFVAGVDTAKDLKALCIVLAAVMQYFFLASFFWMLSEGIMLYLLVVKVFGNAAQRWYWLLLVGWGVPFPIVVISAGVLQENYISQHYCWLEADPRMAAIWTFLVPMILVILVNTVILILTVISIVRGKKHGGAETEVKARTLAITAIRGTVILLPLLGITWVIGLFQVNNDTLVFAWIFVFLNSFQGLFIFVIHVLRNGALLRRIKQRLCKSGEKTKSGTTSSMLMSNKFENKTSNLDHNNGAFSPDYPSDKKFDLSPDN